MEGEYKQEIEKDIQRRISLTSVRCLETAIK